MPDTELPAPDEKQTLLNRISELTRSLAVAESDLLNARMDTDNVHAILRTREDEWSAADADCRKQIEDLKLLKSAAYTAMRNTQVALTETLKALRMLLLLVQRCDLKGFPAGAAALWNGAKAEAEAAIAKYDIPF